MPVQIGGFKLVQFDAPGLAQALKPDGPTQAAPGRVSAQTWRAPRLAGREVPSMVYVAEPEFRPSSSWAGMDASQLMSAA